MPEHRNAQSGITSIDILQYSRTAHYICSATEVQDRDQNINIYNSHSNGTGNAKLCNAIQCKHTGKQTLTI